MHKTPKYLNSTIYKWKIFRYGMSTMNTNDYKTRGVTFWNIRIRKIMSHFTHSVDTFYWPSTNKLISLTSVSSFTTVRALNSASQHTTSTASSNVPLLRTPCPYTILVKKIKCWKWRFIIFAFYCKKRNSYKFKRNQAQSCSNYDATITRHSDAAIFACFLEKSIEQFSISWAYWTLSSWFR